MVRRKSILNKTLDLALRISPRLKRSLVRIWYELMSALDKEELLVYMNFGYIDLNPDAKEIELRDGDEKNRYCIQMYHHVAGSIDLKGLDVLEVGCGRGGGASYIMRYLKPKSMTGVDIAEKAIAFCKRYHTVEGLSFHYGDAESLPFEDNTFDVIVNIESSQCYGSIPRFLGEVYRILRPNGYFLFADHRSKEGVEILRRQVTNSDLALLKEEKINANVLKALDLDNERKLRLIQQKVPKLLMKPFQEFAGIRGTGLYEDLRTGALEYRSFILYKREVQVCRL
ncbi:MAG: class I SAM-dependent methyltransferase [Ktedonobacteraceae bacterium]